VGEPASDLTTLHQGVDVALNLSLLKAVFGRELRHEIAIAFERGQILHRDAPLRPDFREEDLFSIVSCGSPLLCRQQIEPRAPCRSRTDLRQPQALRFTTPQRFVTMRLANANSYTIRMNV
jgi:hypothetical protein